MRYSIGAIQYIFKNSKFVGHTTGQLQLDCHISGHVTPLLAPRAVENLELSLWASKSASTLSRYLEYYLQRATYDNIV